LNVAHLPARAPIRLPRAAYREPGSAWLVTISTFDRQPSFVDPMFGGAVAAVLIEVTETSGVLADIYCLMPDHLHAVMQVTTGDLVSTIQAFKSISTRLWFDWGGAGKLWQRSFHDRGGFGPVEITATPSTTCSTTLSKRNVQNHGNATR
jgi:REP element-mobilizing transposase RayT